MVQPVTKKNLNILFLTYHFPKDNEPGAFRPWITAKLLKQSGFNITVITSGVHYMTGENIRPNKSLITEEFVDGIRILKTWAPTNYRRNILWRLTNYLCFAIMVCIASLVKTKNVDKILAGTDPFFVLPVVFILSIVKKAQFVLDERDLYPETAIYLGVISDGKIAAALKKIARLIRKKASGIIAATPGIFDHLIKEGLPEEKLFLMYNADPFINRFEYESKIEIKKLINKKFIVGYFGGLGRFHDIFTLLKAGKLMENDHDIGIIIVGNGEQRKDYQAICEEQKINNVFFFNSVARNEARALIKQIDIGVHLFRGGEFARIALGSKIFDYIGMGTPVLFCGEGNTRDLLNESGAGLSVSPSDPESLADLIQQIKKDPQELDNLSRSAIAWYEKNITVLLQADILCRAIER